MMFKSNSVTAKITRAAVISAAYAALTIVLAPISFGALQFRVSEALCILPYFFPEAIPGLFVGCIIANLFTPNFLIADVIFGSLATLLAALFTRFCSKLKKTGQWIAPLPPVILNAIIVGAVITYSLSGTGEAFAPAFIMNAASVGIGELGVMYVIGLPFLLVIKKYFLKKVFPAER